MVYSFGDISFRPITMPSDFSMKKSVNLAEKERLLGKPTLQDVGGILDTINWRIELHYEFCDVRGSINKFYELLLSKEPKELIAGTGRNEGEFVLTEVEVQFTKLDGKGKPIVATLNVQLKEYVTAQLEDKEAGAARRAAVATISANPITVTPVPKFQSPTSIVMRDIVVTNASVGSAVSAAKKAESIQDLSKKYINEMNQALQTGKTAMETARQNVDAVANKVSNVVALKAGMDTVISNMNSLLSEGLLPEPNLENAKNIAGTLENSMNGLMSTSSILANVIALRK